MTTRDQLEPQLRRWMVGQPDESGEDALLRSVVATTRRLPQRRGLRARLAGRRASAPDQAPGRASVGTSARTRRLLAIGLVAVVGAGAVAIGVGAPRPSPSTPLRTAGPPAGPHDLPLLGGPIPEGVDSGVLDTALGPVRWAHLSGTRDTLPDLGTLTPWMSGWVTVEGGDPSEDPPRPARWWSSPDGFSWTAGPLPLLLDPPGAGLAWGGDAWWLRAEDPLTLWRSADGTAWEPVDLDAVEPAGAPAMDWVVDWTGEPVTAGGATVIPAMYAGRIGPLLGLAGAPDDLGLEARSDGRWAIVNENGQPVVIVTVEESDTGLRLLDPTGDPLADLAGATDAFLTAWAEAGRPTLVRLLVLEGNRLVASVPLPGPELSSDPGLPALLADGDTLLAFAVVGDGTVMRWESRDGRTWTAGVPAGVQGSAQAIRPRGSAVLAWAREPWRSWWIEDADTVLASGELNPDIGPPTRVPGGWLAFDEENLMRVRPDGGVWTPVAISDVIKGDPDLDSWGSNTRMVGDVLAHQIFQDGGVSHAWYLDFGRGGS